jgi:hypothetical protein
MQIHKGVVVVDVDKLINFINFRNEGNFIHFLSIIPKGYKGSGGEAPPW